MTLQVGLQADHEMTVTEAMTADAMGNPGIRVLSTPALVQHLENTAIRSVSPHLGTDEGTVGSELHLRHLAATPVGMRIRLRATLVEVDGRRLMFDLEGHDDQEKIAEGRHERYVVNMARFLARASSKISGD